MNIIGKTVKRNMKNILKKTQTITASWQSEVDRKTELWNKVDKLIVERDYFIMKQEWGKAAQLYIKLSILIYKNLK